MSATATPNVLTPRTRVLVASADPGFRKRMMTNPLYASVLREEASGGAHALARLGVSWNYMPSFIDVFEYHHAPERAQHDPYLVGIIAAADQFLIAQASAAESHPDEASAPGAGATPLTPSALLHSASPQTVHFEPETSDSLQSADQSIPAYLPQCLPELSDSEHHAVMELMQTEFLHLVPLVQLGMAAAASDDV
jgi:hypothetical protein